MEEYQIKKDEIENAQKRDVLKDVETPEYKLLSDTLEHLEENDYLEQFIEATDYHEFQDKTNQYQEENK